MKRNASDEEYSDKEATKRMNDALRRALSTPHKPNAAFVGKKAKKPTRSRAKPKSP